MASSTLRTLDDEVQRLQQRAAAYGPSIEAEVRSILTAAVISGGLAQDWVEATEELRGAEMPLLQRSTARTVDLG